MCCEAGHGTRSSKDTVASSASHAPDNLNAKRSLHASELFTRVSWRSPNSSLRGFPKSCAPSAAWTSAQQWPSFAKDSSLCFDANLTTPIFSLLVARNSANNTSLTILVHSCRTLGCETYLVHTNAQTSGRPKNFIPHIPPK